MAFPKALASLYVGDLLTTVTEANLFEIFTNIGQIASIRVCRDHLTKRSLGYAYVNYLQLADAERAIDTLNNTAIKGRPCRVMWCQRDPSFRKSGVGNVFIKNLDPVIGHKELYDRFSVFGNILSCKVATDENGHSKGFGFVHYDNQDSATRAIEQYNDKNINNRKVFVGRFESKKERQSQIESSWTNVYIKDLSTDVTEKDLLDQFKKYGTITSAIIMKNDDGTSKGFGFVNLAKHEEAVRAVEALNQIPLGVEQKPIWCGRAQKKIEREAELKNKFKLIKMERIKQYSEINLYIKNLDDHITEEALTKEFSIFGSIRSLKIMKDEKNNSKGFGFICFDAPEAAQRALAEMSNRTLPGSSKPLYVTFHEPREIRRQKLAQEQLQRKQNPRPNLLQAVYPPPGYSYPPNTQYIYPSQLVRQPPPPRNWSQSGHAPQYPQERSQPQHGRQPRPGVPRGKQAPAHPSEGVSIQELSMYPVDQQKILLGEKLYVQIQKKQPAKAGKITGMLLDAGWSLSELVSLLENEEKLNLKIDEALGVLFNPS